MTPGAERPGDLVVRKLIDVIRLRDPDLADHAQRTAEIATAIGSRLGCSMYTLDRVYTAAIDSQRSGRARHDWRRDGIGLIEDWVPHQLPAELEKRLLSFMRYFGLNYGAVDFILTPDGRYVFLEVNPVGEFFWLERNPGLPISAAIADLLVSSE